MADLDTIPESAVALIEPPRLLVEWSSPWEEFKTAIRPALARAPKALAGEAPFGMFPYRGMLASWLLECLLLAAVIMLPERIALLQPVPIPTPHLTWDVIYYSGDELPRTADRGGAQAGKSGRAGGREAHHRTQIIRVARGDKPSEKIVDAPKLNLPRSDSAVANLLAFKPNPGPPPSEGLRSSRAALSLPSQNPVPPSPELHSSTTRKLESPAATVIAPAPDVSRANLRTASPLAANVIAPPPRDAERDLASSRVPMSQTVNVIAPPVSAPSSDTSSRAKLTLPAPAVVAPPPAEVSRDLNSWGSAPSGEIRSQPVPPPPSAAGAGSFARSHTGTLTPQVVPPPANLEGLSAAGSSGSGSSGRGNKGAGSGASLDLGSPLAPPSNGGGNGNGSGVVISSQPGSKVGLPNSSGGGAIAMSPTGTGKTGLGGSGGGSGIGRGNGPGSGLAGEGTGAGNAKDSSGKEKEGGGRGSDLSARGGISPYPGSGGAGRGTSGSPAMPGVSVEGGTTTITLPSFGPPGGDAAPGSPSRSSADKHTGSGITIEATPRSGGVFAYYGLLKGDRNYSIYIETSIGTAVMQYADPTSATHPYGEALTAPEPMHKELPAGLRPTRVIVACILDRSGLLKNVKVLEPGAAETTSKIRVALQGWKFRPAFRGNEAVEVNAILGFGVDTR